MKTLMVMPLLLAACDVSSAGEVEMRSIARDFRAYPMVDELLRDEVRNNPEPPPPSPVRSRAAPGSPHGGRLSFLYAAGIQGYFGSGQQAEGQVLVLETWSSPGEGAELFVMSKSSNLADDSNGGWIYGIVAPGGRVSAVGRLASCMACHRQAPNDRVFGLPR